METKTSPLTHAAYCQFRIIDGKMFPGSFPVPFLWYFRSKALVIDWLIHLLDVWIWHNFYNLFVLYMNWPLMALCIKLILPPVCPWDVHNLEKNLLWPRKFSQTVVAMAWAAQNENLHDTFSRDNSLCAGCGASGKCSYLGQLGIAITM